MEYERSRLAAAGRPDLRPTWASLEDNTLGYDILSWSVLADGSARELAIEVKSGRSSPVLIHISRGEWRYAASNKSHLFHVWDVSEEKLRVMKSAEINVSVPENRGSGSWESFTLAVQV
jgi:hypothetical protein